MKYLKILGFGIFIIALVTGILLIPRKIVIQEIECNSVNNGCSQKLKETLGRYEGRSYYSVSRAVDKLLLEDPNVSEFAFRYKFPNSISVTLIERQAKFTIFNPTTSEIRYVDSEGLIVGEGDSQSLPTLLIENQLSSPGEKVSPQILFALNILYDTSHSFSVKEGKIEADSLLIELQDDLRVIFPLEGDREALIGSLVLIKGELNNTNDAKDRELKSGVKIIDLRFKNPVLRAS